MSASLPLFVDAHTLADRLDDPSIQVVAVDAPGDYASAHIPGALQVAMPDFTASTPPTAGLLPDDDALRAVFSDIGLRNAAHIVAYDRVGDGQAARLLYTLDVMGHGAMSLLDGGLAAWHQAGLALEAGAPQAGASRFAVERQPERIADRDWIKAHLDDPGTGFLDARSAAEYAGSDVRSARGGHIPGAVNLDWNQLKGADGRLRARDELHALMAHHDIGPQQDIVNYCQSHVRSSYTYLVLKHLGFDKVRGYPGAWSDWGNTNDTPVETTDNA